jgi:transposase
MRVVLVSRPGCVGVGVRSENVRAGRVQDEYEWLWLYAAVEPTTGTGVFLLLPNVDGDCLQLFLRHLRHELGKGPLGIVLDSSGSHHSGQVSWPRGMHPLYLPRYSPELNPAEQIFRHLRKTLSNRMFTTLDELQNALIDALQLTGYPWWVDALNTNLSPPS